MYFYYQRSVLGRYSPALSADAPITRTAEGAKFDIRQVVKVPDEMTKPTLDQLSILFPLQREI